MPRYWVSGAIPSTAAVGLLATAIGTLIAEVHATIDVVAQLHRLQRQESTVATATRGTTTSTGNAATSAVEQIVLENLPLTLSQRLEERQLRWAALPGLQQRALLWDVGLIRTTSGALVQLFVPCDANATTSSAFLSKASLDNNALCMMEACGSNNASQDTTFASAAGCSTLALESMIQCAIEEYDAVTAASTRILWSQERAMERAPDIRVYRFEPSGVVMTASPTARSSHDGSNSRDTTNSTSSSEANGDATLFLITEHPIEPAPATVAPEAGSAEAVGCPQHPPSFFVVPCIQRVASNRHAWCTPARGGYLDLWLDANTSAVAAADVRVGESATSGASPTAVVLAALLLLTLAVAVAVAAVRVLRRDSRAKGLTATTASDDEKEEKEDEDEDIPRLSDGECSAQRQLERQSRPTLLDDPFQMAATTRERVETAARAVGSASCNSMASDIAALNASILRRSVELPGFCTDRALMARRIAFTTLRFDTLLARGANGEVWRGTVGGRQVAIKLLLQEKRYDRSAIEQFAKEIRLASSLEHPNIVQFVGFSWQRLTDLCSVSEFMSRGDLSDVINSTLSARMTWDQEKLSIARDIARALAYLHARSPAIIHRDLKPLNVLLSARLEAKLSDFGLSRARSFEETMTCGIGTLLWTAPEILRGEAYSERADIFSYGVVLSELDTCLPPYALNDEVARRQLTPMQLINLVAADRVRPRLRADCPTALRRLAAACVAPDPDVRPSALQIARALSTEIQFRGAPH